ncbi:hypothetical protein [Herpetosiphon geysericola]|uniref:Uncharacterized protein n=1 Tax=Herpetosiphon geysericola TaxID=70996 RepID=A0A0P6Y2F5_9CHLR|nr:hypothetical protein [Herpetosiphon geysericola]KPL83365.1 hypothetical protein SE18_19325 [Herpetosiphon geysericola]
MKPFQRWLMAFLGISCLVLSVYSYSTKHNLQAIEQRQQLQTAQTGQSLWFSWYDCVEELNSGLHAAAQSNQVGVLTYLSKAQIYCKSSTRLIYSYTIALDFPVKPWWNLNELTQSDSLGFEQLFDHYSSQIAQVKSAIATEGSVSVANRARLQQLHDDIKTFAKQVPEIMLQKGDIAEIHAAIATWCGMVTDVKAKKTIRLTEDQYKGVCK